MSEESILETTPCNDNVLIRREKGDRMTAGGIVLPENAVKPSFRGEILKVGPGKLTEDGRRIPMQFQSGQRVYFSAYSGNVVEEGNEKYIVIPEKNIFAILPPAQKIPPINQKSVQTV